MKKIAIYVRVSTDKQTVENQIQVLNEISQKNNWEIVKIYKDEGVSGSKNHLSRPGFRDLIEGIKNKEFQIVACWSFDRLSRSLKDLIIFLDLINENNIGLYSHQQAIDTTTSIGRIMFQLVGIFAEFERDMIRNRVKEGLKRTQAQGTKLGRPTLTSQEMMKIYEMHKNGYTYSQISKKTNRSMGVISKYLKGKTNEP